jgi:hypothetical protein
MYQLCGSESRLRAGDQKKVGFKCARVMGNRSFELDIFIGWSGKAFGIIGFEYLDIKR